MCFSATASFITAAAAGSIGMLALARTGGAREWPLAAIPVVFSVQQALEGAIWQALEIDPKSAATGGLAFAFLLVAEVLWPVLAPLAVALVEPAGRRRAMMLVCLVLGIGTAIYLLGWIMTRPHAAVLGNHHIVYLTGTRHSDALGVTYLAATTLPFLLATERRLRGLGLIILAGSVVSYLFYVEAFVSVWCFFAASASAVVFAHFEALGRARRMAARSTH